MSEAHENPKGFRESDLESVRRDLDMVMIEHRLETRDKMVDEDTADQIRALPDEAPLRIFFEECFEPEDPDDEYELLLNDLMQHYCCEFFRAHQWHRSQGEPPRVAIEYAESDQIDDLLQLFDRPEEEVPEVGIIDDIADAFKDQLDFSYENLEQPGSD